MKLFVLGLFLGIGVAHAEIGDNLDQLRRRYGEPSKQTVSDDGTVFGLWRWGSFVLLVGFKDGVSHHEAIKRLNGAPCRPKTLRNACHSQKGKQLPAMFGSLRTVERWRAIVP
jgi:hypothetical protein